MLQVDMLYSPLVAEKCLKSEAPTLERYLLEYIQRSRPRSESVALAGAMALAGALCKASAASEKLIVDAAKMGWGTRQCRVAEVVTRRFHPGATGTWPTSDAREGPVGRSWSECETMSY